MTGDPQFYVSEVSLNNILIIGLFCSNNRMIIFSKTEKIQIKQTRKEPYTYNVHIEVGGGGVLNFYPYL